MADRPQTDPVQAQALGNAASATANLKERLGGVLVKAYKDLGQDVLGGSTSDYAGHAGGIRGIPRDTFNANRDSHVGSLAANYATEYVNRTGAAPTTEQISAFVASNYTPRIARGFLEGSVQENTLRGLAEESIQETAPATPVTAQAEPQQDNSALRSRIDELFGRSADIAAKRYKQELEESAIPQRQAIVSEEAALGRLRSPLGAKRLAMFDVGRQGALSKGLADIFGRSAEQRATGEFDLAKLFESQRYGSSEAEKARQFSGRQFDKDFGLRQKTLRNMLDEQDEARRLKQKEMELAALLGREQAEASQPSLTSQIFQGIGSTGQLLGGTGQLIRAFK